MHIEMHKKQQNIMNDKTEIVVGCVQLDEQQWFKSQGKLARKVDIFVCTYAVTFVEIRGWIFRHCHAV